MHYIRTHSCLTAPHSNRVRTEARHAVSYVSVQVKHYLSVLLKNLPLEHFGEYIGRIICSRHILHRDNPRATQLPHLEQLAINVP